MTATTVARSVRDVPRQRHLSVVQAAGFAGGAVTGRAPAVKVAPTSGGGLRLTRRGRLVVAVLGWCAVVGAAGLVVLVFALALGGGADAEVGPGATVPAAEHVVLPGETLWQIASAWSPQEDPREAIDRLVEFNALPGVQLLAGQKIMLPASP